jgi:predicted restriction endonuclease
VEDARQRVLGVIVRRRGQPAFRDALLRAYGACCAISGCSVVEILEAAHIHPYKGLHTNIVSNGLLLRADLHTLFDLGLIRIDGAIFAIHVSNRLDGTEYAQWRGKRLRLAENPDVHPSRGALSWHFEHRSLP